MADGYGFGAEGDWKTAALVRAMKVMAAGLEGGTIALIVRVACYCKAGIGGKLSGIISRAVVNDDDFVPLGEASESL